MIVSERHYVSAKTSIAEFEYALDHPDEEFADMAPGIRIAAQHVIQGELAFLRAEVAEYEALRDGSLAELNTLFDELGSALVKARIAASMTQKDLADCLKVKEQQIQRYEAQLYKQASFTRLKQIVEALQAKVSLNIVLHSKQTTQHSELTISQASVIPNIVPAQPKLDQNRITLQFSAFDVFSGPDLNSSWAENYSSGRVVTNKVPLRA